MTVRPPITDTDLQAYVDEQLDRERYEEVKAYLHNNEDARAMVEEYKKQNALLHTMFDPVLDEALPEHLNIKPVKKNYFLRVAAITAWMMIGGVVGWQVQPLSVAQHAKVNPLQKHLVQPATFAHMIYSVEVRHPVEVTAKQEQHLTKWLSKRLHTDIKAPSLIKQGYTLVGGRLLPSTDRMAAQFMYERADGTRVTLYKRRGSWNGNTTAFRYSEREGVGVFYWVDEKLAYALVGGLSRNELLDISGEVHRQLQ